MSLVSLPKIPFPRNLQFVPIKALSRSSSSSSMAQTSTTDVAHNFRPFFCVFKDGRIQRFDTPFVPPSTDPNTGIHSKDVLISQEPKVSARLYLPKTTTKLPLLIYFHGGAFSSESAFSTLYHTHLNSIVAAAHVVAVSVEFRLAPEHMIPACYEDCWTALKWIALNARNDTDPPEPWFNNHADFRRVFLMGDSAGANIAHNMAVRAGIEGGLGSGVNIAGMVLVHPLFGDGKKNPALWNYTCPETSGPDDSRFNPLAEPKLLAKLGCDNVLVCTASRDELRGVGWNYYKALRDGEWGGIVQHVETEDEKHVFHLFKTDSEKTRRLLRIVSGFINESQIAYSSL